MFLSAIGVGGQGYVNVFTNMLAAPFRDLARVYFRRILSGLRVMQVKYVSQSLW